MLVGRVADHALEETTTTKSHHKHVTLLTGMLTRPDLAKLQLYHQLQYQNYHQFNLCQQQHPILLLQLKNHHLALELSVDKVHLSLFLMKLSIKETQLHVL